MEDRETITEELKSICVFDIFCDTTLSQVQDYLTGIMDNLQAQTKGFRNFRFNADTVGYDGVAEVFIVADRDETDEEYNARLEKKHKAEERRQKAIARSEEKFRRMTEENEAAEKALYEKLREKYGDKQ